MEFEDTNLERKPFFSIKEVQRITGLSRSTIYRQIKRGDFPRPRVLSQRKVAFLKAELESWIQEREPAEDLQCQEDAI